MKNYFRLTIITVIALFYAGAIFSQDKIYRNNPTDTISCKIEEIGEELIKYSTNTYAQNLTFTVDKNNVTKIVFESGKVLTFSDSMFGAEHYQSQRKDALKLSFLSPLMGSSIFSYEHSLKPGQSMEFGFGIIGAGVDPGDDNPSGFIAKFGYKFLTSPNWYDRRHRYAHVLKGFYVKPEATFLHYSVDEDNYYYGDGAYSSNERRSSTMFSLMIVGGKQWVFADVFLLDLFAGIGYGFGHNPDDRSWHYGFLGGTDDTPLALTAGLKVGFLIGGRKKK